MEEVVEKPKKKKKKKEEVPQVEETAELKLSVAKDVPEKPDEEEFHTEEITVPLEEETPGSLCFAAVQNAVDVYDQTVIFHEKRCQLLQSLHAQNCWEFLFALLVDREILRARRIC